MTASPGTPTGARPDPTLTPPVAGKAASLGRQLALGPLLIELNSNPLGWAGTRQVCTGLCVHACPAC